MSRRSQPLKRLNKSAAAGANRHRFQGLHERLNNIHISLSSLSLVNEDTATTTVVADTARSHFIDELARQRELHGFELFNWCVSELRPVTQSFALVVHHQSKIVAVLLHYCQRCQRTDDSIITYAQSQSSTDSDTDVDNNSKSRTSLSTSMSKSESEATPAPFLSLLSALARDLRHELYPQFPTILTTLLSMIDPGNSDTLELIFSTILLLFRFLARQLVNDIESLYQSSFAPLMHHPRWWIRKFVAESLAFLIRKLREEKRRSVYQTLMEPVSDTVGVSDSEHVSAIATLLFYVHKSVQFSLHTLSALSLPQLLSFLLPSTSDSNSERDSSNSHYQIVESLFRRLANHTRREQSTVVWQCLSSTIADTVKHWKALAIDSKKRGTIHRYSILLARLTNILTVWVEHRRGSRIQEPSLVMLHITALLDPSVIGHTYQTSDYRTACHRLLVSFYQLTLSESYHSQLQIYVQATFKRDGNHSDAAELLPLVHALQSHPTLHPALVRHTFTFIDNALSLPQSASVSPSDCLTLLMAICQDYQQHDHFHYQIRSLELDTDELDQPTRGSKLLFEFPTSVNKLLVRIVSESLHVNQYSDNDVHNASMALQLLSLSPSAFTVADVASQLAQSSIDRIQSLNASADITITVPVLLLSAAKHYVDVASQSKRPAAPQPLNLFGAVPAEPVFETRTVTTPVIDSLLFLAARALISRHQLLQPMTVSMFEDSVASEWQYHQSLLSSSPSHPAVLRALLSFLLTVRDIDNGSEILSLQSLEWLAPLVTTNLSHPTPSVRILTAHVLTLLPPLSFTGTNPNSDSITQSHCSMLDYIDDFLSLRPTLANERAMERPLKNLELLAVSQRLPSIYTEMLGHFLLGALYTKLSTVWSSAQKCLAMLMTTHPTVVWPIFYAEFQRNSFETRALVPRSEHDTISASVTDTDSGSDIESSPAITDDSEQVVDDDTDGDDSAPTDHSLPTLAAAYQSFTLVHSRATDSQTYHSLLMKTLTLDDCRAVTEDKCELLSGDFLVFFHSQYQRVFYNDDRIIEPPSSLSSIIDDSDAELVPVPSGRRIARVKLLLFLRLFHSAFNTLSKLGQHRTYFPRFFYRLLTDSDTEVQRLCIDCMDKFNFPFIRPYLDNLHRLIDETTFREELTTFHLDSDAATVNTEHRLPLTAIIIRLLQPKLMQRKLKQNKSSIQTRRTAVFSFLAGLKTDEAANLLVILLQPFLPVLKQAACINASANGSGVAVKRQLGKKASALADVESITAEILPSLPVIDDVIAAIQSITNNDNDNDVSLKRQIGFLRMLELLLTHLRSLMKSYMPLVLTVLLQLLDRANRRIDEIRGQLKQSELTDDCDSEEGEPDADENDDNVANDRINDSGDQRRTLAELRSIRQLIYSRFASILDHYHESFDATVTHTLQPFLYHYLSLAHHSITVMAKENTQHRGGLLHSLVVLSSHPSLLPVLLDDSNRMTAPLLPSVFALLAAPRVSHEVVSAVIEICQHMLEVEQQARDLTEDKQRRDSAMLVITKSEVDDGVRVSFDDSGDSDDSDEDTDMTEAPRSTRLPSTSLSSLTDTDVKRLGSLVSQSWQRHISVFLSSMHAYMDALNSSVPSQAQLKQAQARAIKAHVDSQNKYDPRFRRTAARNAKSPLSVKVKRPFPRRELEIIAAVSVYANDGVTAERLLALLMPLLTRIKDMTGRDSTAIGRLGKARLGRTATQLHILTIIRDCVKLAPQTAQFLSFLSRQFYLIHTPANRAMLAQVFVAMTSMIAMLTPVTPLLMEMTAVNTTRINELDYERIVDAYQSFTRQQYYQTFNTQQLLPLVHLMLHDICHDELGLRSQASHAITLIADRFAEELKLQSLERPANLVTETIFPAVKKGVLHPTDSVRREWLAVLAHLVRTFPVFLSAYTPLLSDNADVDFFTNISHIQRHRRIRAFSRILPLIESRIVTAQAANDFLLPLALSTIMESGGAKTSIDINDSASVDKHSRPYSASAFSGANTSNAQGLIDECVTVVGALSSLLDWSHYHSLINTLIRALKQRPLIEKVLVRTVCAVIDRWHFSIATIEQLNDEQRKSEVASARDTSHVRRKKTQTMEVSHHESKESEASVGEPTDDAADEDAVIDVVEDDSIENVDASARAQALGVKIRSALTRILLPQLHSMLSVKSKGDIEPVIRPTVALAIVSLMQKLPTDFFELHFPRLLTILVTELTKRDQNARDTARKVLVEVLATLGAQYTAQFVNEASAILTRGFQRHVLGYLIFTIFDRLAKITPPITGGLVDGSVPTLMKVMIEELTGEVSKEKDIEAIRRVGREARARKSDDTLEYLASMVSFDAITIIVESLQQQLQENPSSAATVKTIRESLRRVAEGIIRNVGMEPKQLLVFIYKTIKNAATTDTDSQSQSKPVANGNDSDSDEEEKLTEKERSARLRRSKELLVTVQPLSRQAAAARSPQAKSQVTKHRTSVMAHFGLSLLLAQLKSTRLDLGDSDARSMLDPYVNFIATTCLGIQLEITKKKKKKNESNKLLAISDEIITLSLKVYQRLLKIHSLSSIKNFIPHYIAFLFSLFQSGQQSLHAVIFTSVSSVLHECPWFALQQAQAEILFQFISQEINANVNVTSNTSSGSVNISQYNSNMSESRQVMVLDLLDSIIKRKLLSSQLYDIVQRLSEISITHHSAVIRHRCAELILTFLLDYPLGPKRLEQHLLFFIHNLEYSQIDGRLQSLELLSLLVYKFPSQLIDQFVELLFFPLILVLVNDSSEECKKKSALILQTLFTKLGTKKLSQCQQWLDAWLAEGKDDSASSADFNTVARKCAAMQCYGFMLEAKIMDGKVTKKLESHIRTVFKRAKSITDSDTLIANDNDSTNDNDDGEADDDVAVKSEADGNAEDDDDENVGAPVADEESNDAVSSSPSNINWRLVYFTLVTVEKSLSSNNSQYLSLVTRPLVKQMIEFGLSSHTWIRSISARIIGLSLLHCPTLFDPMLVRQALRLSVSQISSLSLSERMSDTVVDNLVKLALATTAIDWKSLDEQSIKEETGSEHANESDEDGDSDSRAITSQLYESVDMSLKNYVLNVTFHRLSFLCRQEGVQRRLAILKFFTRVIEELPAAVYSPYLLTIINPAFRLANAVNVRGEMADLVKTHATTLLELLQSKIGSTIFLPFYQHVRNRVMAIRAARKQKRKQLAVTQPDVNARLKRQKHERAKVSRKRVVEAMKIGKQGAGITGKLIERMKQAREQQHEFAHQQTKRPRRSPAQ